jgi:tetratricopeptide (TPR) repeat protein
MKQSLQQSNVRAPRTKRVVNLRLVFVSVAILAIVAGGAYATRQIQIARNAASILDLADDSASQGDYAKAAEQLSMYLQLRPNDPDAKVRLAEVYDQAARGGRQKAQAISLYYKALGVAPEAKRSELHRRLAKLLIDADKFISAVEEVNIVLAADPNDPEAASLLAQALYGQYRERKLQAEPASVGNALVRAMELNRGNCAAASLFAQICRDEPGLLPRDKQSLSGAERRAMADQLMDALVAAASKDSDAYLARFQYRRHYGLPNADGDLDAALRLSPENPAVLFLAATASLEKAANASRSGDVSQSSRKDFAAAQAHYEHLIQVTPGDERAYLGLGETFWRQGQEDRAIEAWQRGVSAIPRGAWMVRSRLAEAFIAQKKLDQAETLLAALDQILEQAKLQSDQPPSDRLFLENGRDLLRAKFYARKGDLGKAISLARTVATGQKTSSDQLGQAFQAWLLLANAYASLNQWDQAASAYEQMLSLDPKAGQVRQRAAQAWARAGRAELAVRGYEQLLAIHDSPESRVALALACFDREAAMPKGIRNWENFTKPLANAKSVKDKASREDVFRLGLAEARFALLRATEQGKRDQGVREAADILRSVEKSAEGVKSSLSSLSIAYDRLGLAADADRIASQLENNKDFAVEACLLRSQLAAMRGKPEEARKILQSGLERSPADNRSPLQRGLLQLSIREGRLDRATEEFAAIRGDGSNDLDLICQIAELAMESGKIADLETWERKLRDAEGPDGLYWRYYEAWRLLAQTKAPKDARLSQAAELIQYIQKQHPGWPLRCFLEGLLRESQGKPDLAIRSYQEAIQLGDHRLIVYERLIALLGQANRLTEADGYLSTLQDQAFASQGLASLEIASAVRRGQSERAMDIAKQAAERRPQDATAQIWLGQLLLANGQMKEAEAAFRRAVDLAPNEAQSWTAWIGFLVRTKQMDSAQKALQRLADSDKLQGARKSLALAQGAEMLGDAAKAKNHYRQAAQQAANAPDTVIQLVQCLLRTGQPEDVREAESVLRSIMKQSPQYAAARRLLAEVLVERGGDAEWREAQRLLEQADEDRAAAQIDRRLQAVLLLRRGGSQNREAAKEILQQLSVDPQTAMPLDRLLLAQIEENEGRPEEARKQYRLLTDRANPPASHLAAYVRFLLRHGPKAEAESRLKELEAASPDTMGTMALRAQAMFSQQRTAEIVPLVAAGMEKLLAKQGKDPQREAQLCQDAGTLLMSVEQYAAAESWFRRLFKLQPERFEPLAHCLVRQDRMKDAIDLCIEAAKSDKTARPAIVLGALLADGGRTTPSDSQRARAFLADAIQRNQKNTELLLGMASVHVIEQRLDEAIQVYRMILAAEPGNALARNNLATLLGEKAETRKEAIEQVDLAIKAVGPQPWLLDTKGMVLVHEGRADEAVALLRQATAVSQPDPRHCLHLALAYDRQGATDKARAALEEAHRGAVERQILTPDDRKLQAELEKKLKP